MQVLKIINSHNYNVPFTLGSEVGHGGADGQVFNLIHHSNKVIKLSVLFDYNFNSNYDYVRINKTINYIKDNNVQPYVRVYKYAYVGKYNRVIHNNVNQDYHIYYYVMEKLNKISEDESKVFHTILSHEDRGIKKDFSIEKIDEVLFGLSHGLDFDLKKIKVFYDNIKRAPIKHLDLHTRNIMKDNFGNFKLIDLDRLQMENNDAES